MVDIIETNLKPNGTMRKNIVPSIIVIDHSNEEYSDIESLDKKDKEKGLPMFSHHYLVKKNGYIFRGRDEEYESYIDEKFGFNVIGIMVEGNFDIEEMNITQLNNLIALIRDITERNKFILNNIYLHSEINKKYISPGRLFPFVEFKNRLINNYLNQTTNCLNINNEVVYRLGSRTLEYKIPNMVGDDIYALKLKLVELGYSIKNIDNVYNEETENQIMYFQKENGLYDNGKVTSVEYKLIEEQTAKKYLDRSNKYKRYLYYDKSLDTHYHSKLLSGTDVEALELKLSSLNYYTGKKKGRYTKELADAVREFQKDNKMSVTGEVGPLTFKLIMDSKDYSFKRVLELTEPIMEGNDVEIIQKRLYAKGYNLDINGFYDRKTFNAVCQYQLDNDFLVNGKIDEELFGQILS